MGPFRVFVARTDPDGTRHAFDYDSQMRLTAVTNPAGLRWTYAFDPAGNLVGETDFNGRTLIYDYDAAGRIIERVNGVGQHVALVRDVLGRVVEQRVDGEHVAAFEYDANGNLTAASSAETELRYRMDGLGGSSRRASTASRCAPSTTPSARSSSGRRRARASPPGATTRWACRSRSPRTAGSNSPSGTTRSAARPTAGSSSNTALTQDFDAVGRMTARRLLAVEGGATSA